MTRIKKLAQMHQKETERITVTLEELTAKHQDACQGEFQARQVCSIGCYMKDDITTPQALTDERRAREEDRASFQASLGELERQLKSMDNEVSTRDEVLRQLQEEVCAQ